MANDFKVADLPRFEAAMRRFDEANARDPNWEDVGGARHPRELIYARRLTEWVMRLCPSASEELRLAARCQHICRWLLPRDSYPPDRQGYLRWREELKRLHAEKSGGILTDLGYPPETVARVQELNLKKRFPHDPETRVLEDALCLVFLEHQLPALAARTSREKMINALRKSWEKMTPAAQEIALGLAYEARERSLLEEALGQRM